MLESHKRKEEALWDFQDSFVLKVIAAKAKKEEVMLHRDGSGIFYPYLFLPYFPVGEWRA